MNMKNFITIIVAFALVISAEAAKPKVKRTVVYSSTITCNNCKAKVMDNIAFEKGVKDVSVNLKDKTITIKFEEAKTDTLALAKSIRKLGYAAKVIKYE